MDGSVAGLVLQALGRRLSPDSLHLLTMPRASQYLQHLPSLLHPQHSAFLLPAKDPDCVQLDMSSPSRRLSSPLDVLSSAECFQRDGQCPGRGDTPWPTGAV